MALCPGLCAEFAATPFRLFLGTAPSKKVEAQLVRQMIPVHAWFSSRRRIREHANEYLELDLASCDAELILRYCGVPFIRRFLFNELVDKQLTLIETGKAVALPDSGLMNCLEDCISTISPQIEWERRELEKLSFSISNAGSSPAPLETYDILFLMRRAEEMVDHRTPDAEMRARSFLSNDLVHQNVTQLAQRFFGDDKKLAVLDKRDQKLLQRQIPADVLRVGGTEKFRPCDVTTYYRFMGERISKALHTGGVPNRPSYFHHALVGNLFKKFALNPVYLQQTSMYWARFTGVDSSSPLTTMPAHLSSTVCRQQQLFPAMKLQGQFLYTSPDIARRQWRTDAVMPLLRLFPLMGRHMAEDLAAQLAAEAIWVRDQIMADSGQIHVVKILQERIRDTVVTFDQSPEGLRQLLMEGAMAMCPPVGPGSAVPESDASSGTPRAEAAEETG